MGVLFGLFSAFGYGAGDFIMRFSTERIGAYRSMYYAQFVGFSALGVYLVFSGELARLIANAPTHAWLWGIVAGIFNFIPVIALYTALTAGIVSVVAPIVSSYAAVTLVLSLLTGETISGTQWLGIVITMIGIILSALAPTHEAVSASRPRFGIIMAILSSIGFGGIFWLQGFFVVPDLGGIGAVWVTRTATLLIFPLIALGLRQRLLRPPRTVWRLLLLGGALDTFGFLTSMIGFEVSGDVAIVTLLSSLFSAVTVLLARLFLREPLRAVQWVGIGVIFVGVTLVSL